MYLIDQCGEITSKVSYSDYRFLLKPTISLYHQWFQFILLIDIVIQSSCRLHSTVVRRVDFEIYLTHTTFMTLSTLLKFTESRFLHL